MGGRVPNFNATSGPQLTAEAEFSSVKLVLKFCCEWVGGLTDGGVEGYLNIMPLVAQLTAETEFSSVKLVSWG